MFFRKKTVQKKIQAALDKQNADADRAGNTRLMQEVGKIKAQLGYGGYGGNHSYNAGRNAGAKWDHGLSGYARGIVLNHWALRQSARKAVHESPTAKAIVNRFADTVADKGLILEPTPTADILGISIEEVSLWSRNVASKFELWAKSKKQNRSGTINFYQSHRLYQIGQHRDNDMFIRLYYSKDRSLLNPLQFEFIDPSQIRGDSATTSFGIVGNYDGILRDSHGREKSYKIWIRKINKDGETDEYKEVEIPAVGSKSGRRFMLHGFVPEYAGQRRGFSRLAGAIQDFQNITDFASAQIKKAIIQSCLAIYVKPSKDAPASNPFEDILTKDGVGPASDSFQATSGTNATITATDGSQQRVNYAPLPEATMNMPGAVGAFSLEGGEDLKGVTNTAPADGFDTFIDTFTAYLSASLSIPIEVVLMRFGKNYSASRGALILFWRVAVQWREEMASDYLDPVYAAWLSEEIAMGRISAPGWSDPILRAAWLNSRWAGSPMPNIDPMRTANADMTYARMGATTLNRISRDNNGSSGEANRAQLKREYEELPPDPWFNNDDGNNSDGDGDE
ncbi:MAG: phage portal protein [Calditrichia bacterium]